MTPINKRSILLIILLGLGIIVLAYYGYMWYQKRPRVLKAPKVELQYGQKTGNEMPRFIPENLPGLANRIEGKNFEAFDKQSGLMQSTVTLDVQKDLFAAVEEYEKFLLAEKWELNARLVQENAGVLSGIRNGQTITINFSPNPTGSSTLVTVNVVGKGGN